MATNKQPSQDTRPGFSCDETAATPTGTTPPSYRPPQMFALGTAAELLRRDGGGHLKDGTGGWWVWGS